MRRVAGIALALILVMQVQTAAAVNPWQVDDTCRVSTSGTYFYVHGPLTGWYVHSGSGYGNNCHLYTYTTANSNPINQASYLLPLDPNYNIYMKVRAYINCHHNASPMKYHIYLFGSAGGVSATALKYVSSVCNGWTDVISPLLYRASQGASIRLVDNVGYTSEPQNADTHIWVP